MATYQITSSIWLFEQLTYIIKKYDPSGKRDQMHGIYSCTNEHISKFVYWRLLLVWNKSGSSPVEMGTLPSSGNFWILYLRSISSQEKC